MKEKYKIWNNAAVRENFKLGFYLLATVGMLDMIIANFTGKHLIRDILTFIFG